MNNFAKYIFISCLILSVFMSFDLNAHYSISVGKNMSADGIYIDSDKLSITVGGTFKGSGYCKSPEIYITVGKFEFTGTIHCDGVCVIISKESFDENLFKRSGNGKFVINIISNEIKDSSGDILVSAAVN